MKAAETLALRGHQVTLFEEHDRLGGQVELILKMPKREQFAWLVTDLERHLEQLGVDVRLGQRADAEMVRSTPGQDIILATGAVPDRDGFTMAAPTIPRIAGAQLPHVMTGWDVLAAASYPAAERS
jgi:NADPH-dependent 2,4-dienoyl-CoA reductase/sulfur reductase-like enzyme